MTVIANCNQLVIRFMVMNNKITHNTLTTNSTTVKTGEPTSIVKAKADYEKPEPTVNVHGHISLYGINSETHSKIILRNETIQQLVDYVRRDEVDSYQIEDSFDVIISRLINKHTQQKQKKRL